jgi:hypothetical protein
MAIKWLMVDNFLSFGENNFVHLVRLGVLRLLIGTPNQGGKNFDH